METDFEDRTESLVAKIGQQVTDFKQQKKVLSFKIFGKFLDVFES